MQTLITDHQRQTELLPTTPSGLESGDRSSENYCGEDYSPSSEGYSSDGDSEDSYSIEEYCTEADSSEADRRDDSRADTNAACHMRAAFAPSILLSCIWIYTICVAYHRLPLWHRGIYAHVDERDLFVYLLSQAEFHAMAFVLCAQWTMMRVVRIRSALDRFFGGTAQMILTSVRRCAGVTVALCWLASGILG